MNENIMLAALKSGREAVFRQFFDTYYDSLVLFANHILNDSEVAEDVVQECFVDFWVNKRYEGITSGPDKYIFQAVKHSSLNYIRGLRRRTYHHIIAVQEQQEESCVAEEEPGEQMEMLYAAISRLPEERKKIFTLICVEGKKYQEAADLLQISVNTVKTQMGRAFRFLREELGGDKFSMVLLKILFAKRNV